MSRTRKAGPRKGFAVISVILVCLPAAFTLLLMTFSAVIALLPEPPDIPDNITMLLGNVITFAIPTLSLVGLAFGVIIVARPATAARRAVGIAGICMCSIILIVSGLLILFTSIFNQSSLNG